MGNEGANPYGFVRLRNPRFRMESFQNSNCSVLRYKRGVVEEGTGSLSLAALDSSL